MKSVGIFLGLAFFFLSTQGSFAQPSRAVGILRAFAQNDTPAAYSPKVRYLTLAPGGNLHYLFPFYYAFKDEKKFKATYSEKGYDDELSQYFAFAGDEQTALEYLVKSYDPIDDATRAKIFGLVDGLQDITHVDARRYIHFRARSARVVMINEAYAKPLHRAFVISLLAGLYQEGFHYLAMEMLNNHADHTLKNLTLRTGYYTAEPVAGELVRTALALGYTLVSYEDTAAASHTPNQRDSIQAGNIYKILQQDSSAKILVEAGYAHISKKMGEDGYVPMGLAFKNISGIDPLTIDQTDMSDEGNFGYGRVLYQAYCQKYHLATPSVAMAGVEPVNITNNDLYDLAVIHPQTIYQDGRPTWLTLDSLRKPLYIKPPPGRTFLVQAYYEDELKQHNGKTWQIVPADQTYIPSANKNFLLYLKKGKYRIFFRDLDYHILGTLDIEAG